MKIAYTGAHGTGKTSSVYRRAAKEKLKSSKNIVVLTEIARQCPFPINEESTIDSQLWMFSTQLKKELDLSLCYDYIICDRSLVDYCAYAYFVDKKLYTGMFHICNTFVHTYDKIYFNSVKYNQYLIDDGIRSIDFDFQQRIEDKLFELYELMNYNVEVV